MDYQKVYTSLISKRKEFPLKKTKELYTELHHILPRCLGGSDNKENLIRLTAREHFIAHRLLAKIHPDQTGLSKAVFAMCSINGMKVSSKTYHVLKQNFCKSAAATMIAVNSDPVYIANKSANTPEQWKNDFSRNKLLNGLKRSWCDNTQRRAKAAQVAREQMKDPRRIQHTFNNLKKMQGDASWNAAASISRGTRPYWALAALFWRCSEFNPNNNERAIKAVEFSRLYDCGERAQVYQRMIVKFRQGWVPHEDPLWLRDFGDCF